MMSASPPLARNGGPAAKTAVRISGLTTNIRRTHLADILAWYGRVLHVHLRNDEAVVQMETEEQAAKATLYLTGGQIDGQYIRITSIPTPDPTPTRQSSDQVRPSRFVHPDRQAHLR